jgi:hypothetical protein
MRRLKAPLTTASAAAALALLAIAAPSASAAPTIAKTSVSHVSATSATLQAEINPEGKATKYHFEYGSADCSSNPCAATPDGKGITGSSPVAVEAQIEGLTPGATYHFRAVAGATNGADAAFTTQLPPQAFGPCPNDAYRAGALSPPDHPSASLPDCRAYEQASPTDKNGGDVTGIVSALKASSSGDAVTFLTYSGIPGGEGGQEFPLYLARRGGADWSSQGMLPPSAIGERAFVEGWTPDFSEVFSETSRLNEPESTFLARAADGSLATIAPYGSGLSQPFLEPSYAGASADGSLAFLEPEGQLEETNAIPDKRNVYAWDRNSGKLFLASVMNDGNPPPQGAVAGAYDWISGEASGLIHGGARDSFYTQDNHAVSADGSLYFTASGSGQLYLRENPAKEQSQLDGSGNCADAAKACTIHISASEKTNGHGEGGADAAGARPAAFMAASKDGSKALFTSTEKLTDDANTGPEPEPGIGRSDIEGKNADLGFCPTIAKGIALDDSHIYWASPTTGTINRANLECKEAKAIVTGANNPQYVAVDSEHVYWTNAGDGKKGSGTIGRAKLDGTEADQELIEGATDPQGIALDSEHVYWANAGEEDATRTIGRAKLDGTEATQTFIAVGGGPEENTPQGLAVNPTHIYMAIDGTQQFSFIFRYDIDGDPASRRISGAGGLGGAAVRGVAIDDSYVYWARQRFSTIGRISLSQEEGTNKREFIKEAGNPQGLAANSEHLYWSVNGEVTPNPGNDLYRYDVKTPAGERLTDLTPDPSEENGAEVKGVLGASQDASYVYFAANGDLDGPSGPASAGDCHGKAGVFVQYSGECSLYLYRAGQVEFIAPLDAKSDATDWLPKGVSIGGEKTARVSADGQTLLFASTRRLTPYDNEGASELYRYRAGAGLLCVSCNPTGEAGGGGGLGFITFPTLRAADPAFTLSRNLSADGNRVFFESTEALLPADTNGEDGCPLSAGQNNNAKVPVCKDVYEWEAKGTGSCESQAQNGGCLYLLSSGKSDQPSYFLDASASGEDAFLITRSAFARQDGDQLFDVYDARVSGGLASQNQPPPPLCEAEGCKSEPSAPPQGRSPGSASFSGPGNPKPHKPKPRCGKGRRAARAKSKSRCTARHHKRETKSSGRQSR